METQNHTIPKNNQGRYRMNRRTNLKTMRNSNSDRLKHDKPSKKSILPESRDKSSDTGYFKSLLLYSSPITPDASKSLLINDQRYRKSVTDRWMNHREFLKSVPPCRIPSIPSNSDSFSHISAASLPRFRNPIRTRHKPGFIKFSANMCSIESDPLYTSHPSRSTHVMRRPTVKKEVIIPASTSSSFTINDSRYPENLVDQMLHIAPPSAPQLTSQSLTLVNPLHEFFPTCLSSASTDPPSYSPDLQFASLYSTPTLVKGLDVCEPSDCLSFDSPLPPGQLGVDNQELEAVLGLTSKPCYSDGYESVLIVGSDGEKERVPIVKNVYQTSFNLSQTTHVAPTTDFILTLAKDYVTFFSDKNLSNVLSGNDSKVLDGNDSKVLNGSDSKVLGGNDDADVSGLTISNTKHQKNSTAEPEITPDTKTPSEVPLKKWNFLGLLGSHDITQPTQYPTFALPSPQTKPAVDSPTLTPTPTPVTPPPPIDLGDRIQLLRDDPEMIKREAELEEELISHYEDLVDRLASRLLEVEDPSALRNHSQSSSLSLASEGESVFLFTDLAELYEDTELGSELMYSVSDLRDLGFTPQFDLSEPNADSDDDTEEHHSMCLASRDVKSRLNGRLDNSELGKKPMFSDLEDIISSICEDPSRDMSVADMYGSLGRDTSDPLFLELVLEGDQYVSQTRSVSRPSPSLSILNPTVGRTYSHTNALSVVTPYDLDSADSVRPPLETPHSFTFPSPNSDSHPFAPSTLSALQELRSTNISTWVSHVLETVTLREERSRTNDPMALRTPLSRTRLGGTNGADSYPEVNPEDIADRVRVWTSETEASLEGLELFNNVMPFTFEELARLSCAVLDIPVHKKVSMTDLLLLTLTYHSANTDLAELG